MGFESEKTWFGVVDWRKTNRTNRLGMNANNFFSQEFERLENEDIQCRKYVSK
jgi:hypothetical protein